MQQNNPKNNSSLNTLKICRVKTQFNGNQMKKQLTSKNKSQVQTEAATARTLGQNQSRVSCSEANPQFFTIQAQDQRPKTGKPQNRYQDQQEGPFQGIPVNKSMEIKTNSSSQSGVEHLKFNTLIANGNVRPDIQTLNTQRYTKNSDRDLMAYHSSKTIQIQEPRPVQLNQLRATKRLMESNQNRLAAYSISLNAEKIKGETNLYPLAPAYSEVTDYLIEEKRQKQIQQEEAALEEMLHEEDEYQNYIQSEKTGGLAKQNTISQSNIKNKQPKLEVLTKSFVFQNDVTDLLGKQRPMTCRNQTTCSAKSLHPIQQNYPKCQRDADSITYLQKQRTIKNPSYKVQKQNFKTVDSSECDVSKMHRSINWEKTAFQAQNDGGPNYDAILNQKLTESMEKDLQETLTCKPSIIYDEATIENECKVWYNRTYHEQKMAGFENPVAFYEIAKRQQSHHGSPSPRLSEKRKRAITESKRGTSPFSQKSLNASTMTPSERHPSENLMAVHPFQFKEPDHSRLLGDDYKKLPVQQQQILLDLTRLQQQLNQACNPEVAQAKQESLKNELQRLKRARGGAGKVGFSEMERRTKELVKQSTLKRKATVIEEFDRVRRGQTQQLRVDDSDREANNISPADKTQSNNLKQLELQTIQQQFSFDEKYQEKYVKLSAFLQNYKEKLLLTKKVHQMLDLEVVTFDHLRKVKEGYTDQFNLDYQQLVKVYEAEKNEGKVKDELIDVKNKSSKSESKKVDGDSALTLQKKVQRRSNYSRAMNIFGRATIRSPKQSQAKIAEIERQEMQGKCSSYATFVKNETDRMKHIAKDMGQELKKDINDTSHVKHLHKSREREFEKNQIKQALDQIKNSRYNEGVRNRVKDISGLVEAFKVELGEDQQDQ